MRLLLAVSVPPSENEDEVLAQLTLSKHEIITVMPEKGIVFDVELIDIERADLPSQEV